MTRTGIHHNEAVLTTCLTQMMIKAAYPLRWPTTAMQTAMDWPENLNSMAKMAYRVQEMKPIPTTKIPTATALQMAKKCWCSIPIPTTIAAHSRPNAGCGATLAGLAFEDENYDGQYNEGETLLNNVEVKLYRYNKDIFLPNWNICRQPILISMENISHTWRARQILCCLHISGRLVIHQSQRRTGRNRLWCNRGQKTRLYRPHWPHGQRSICLQCWCRFLWMSVHRRSGMVRLQ